MSNFQMDVLSYLNRIGIHEIPAPTEENLKKLTRAHLEAVPFENLLVCQEGNIPSLDPGDLYAKIVERRRGGWCFEVNKLFLLLLQDLGYTCRAVPCRVMHETPELRPVSHRATVAEVEGRLWFCDVGFGGSGPRGALRMDTAEPQTVFGEKFRIEPDQDRYPGEHLLSIFDNGRWKPVLTFRDHSQWREPDFDSLNILYALWEETIFKNAPVLFRCTPDGWVTLVKNRLTRKTDCQVQKEDLAEDQIKQIMETEFGLR